MGNNSDSDDMFSDDFVPGKVISSQKINDQQQVSFREDSDGYICMM
jgi:hypothetical protein